MINKKVYNMNNNNLSPIALRSFISLFWDNVYAKLDHKNCYLTIMVKVQFDSNVMQHRSLANLRKVSYEDKFLFSDYICDNLAILSESYTSTVVEKLIFTYMIHKGEVPSMERSFLALKKAAPLATAPTHKVKENWLPISMNPKDFGSIIKETVTLDGNASFLIKGPNNQIFDIEVLCDGHVIKGQIVGGTGANSQFFWQDVKQGKGFIRTVGDKLKWVFINGKEISIKTVPCKAFKVYKKDRKINKKIFT